MNATHLDVRLRQKILFVNHLKEVILT
jgi:hypothetical protein